MNTIGIEHLRTLTQVAVLEGAAGRGVLHSVSDGARTAIPSAAEADRQAWASAALALQGEPSPEALRAPAWRIPADEAYFWARLAERLAVHLGRGTFGLGKGYLVTLATQDGAHSDAVDETFKAAGIPPVVRIPASSALLSAFIAGVTGQDAKQGVVIAVAVGDTEIEVCAFGFEDGGARRAGVPVHLQGNGHATLAGRLRRLIEERLPEPLPDAAAPVMRDALTDYAMTLSTATPDEAIAWKGPFAPSMYTPLELTPRGCGTWAEARHLISEITAAIGDTVRSLNADSPPSRIILGGIGTVWPCIERALASIAPIWPSGPAPRLVAEGAALWPVHRSGRPQELRLPRRTAGICDDVAPLRREVPADRPAAPPARAATRPPWQRPRNVLEDGGGE